MEHYELSHLIDALTYVRTTLERADDREKSLTHGQKHYLIQTALIILRDMQDEYEHERRKLERPIDYTGDIPF
jgi:hypothetical protein